MSQDEEKIHKAMFAPVLAMIPGVVVGNGKPLDGYPDMFCCKPAVGEQIIGEGKKPVTVTCVCHKIDENGLPYLVIHVGNKRL